jgi:signal transduction histidine kinase
MIETINNYLDIEQESLVRRATFLSGVSHDLGTPATRLKLRAQTIEDEELRDRLNGDIDQMTSMIDSVLQYTQSEMKLEDLRQISLQSLVDAIVSDFQDANQPVKFVVQDSLSVSAKTILFNSKPKLFNSKILSTQNVIIYARPLSMQRAITNLIDNALKYGRKANVSLQADSQKASIIIDDYGDSEPVENLKQLTVPFKRGKNAKNIKGTGIGLAIVSTIAEQHGGNLTFDSWEEGVRAILSIPR